MRNVRRGVVSVWLLRPANALQDPKKLIKRRKVGVIIAHPACLFIIAYWQAVGEQYGFRGQSVSSIFCDISQKSASTVAESRNQRTATLATNF